MRLSAEDHARVTAAVTAAETHTDGEIVTVVARQSDPYHDVGLHWTVLAMLSVLAILAIWPAPIEAIYGWFGDPWGEALHSRMLLSIVLVVMAVTFLVFRYLFAWKPLRLAVTPAGTKARRVRRRALKLFRTGAEKRTKGATGVLLYVSLDEHRAEIIADEAIHSRVDEGVWGHAMAALIAALKDGRPGDGMAEAVREIGVVLAEHFPRSAGDTNELPDRLIEL